MAETGYLSTLVPI